jgi:hypothetical protein
MRLIREIKLEYVLVCQLYVSQYEIVEIMLFFTNTRVLFFACHSYSCALDTTLVPTTPGGLAEAYGYLMQPAAELLKVAQEFYFYCMAAY